MRGAVLCAAAAALLSVGQVWAGGHGVAVAGSAAACAEHGTDITGHVSGMLSGDQKTLDVALNSDSFQLTAVGVRGGGDLELYVGGSFSGLTAPENPGGQNPGISGWFACGVPVSEQPPDPPAEPSPPEPSSPAPSSPEPTESPSPSETPEPTESPSETGTASSVPAPTSIPAGIAPSRGGTLAGPLVLLGAGLVAMSGALFALVVRRRRSHG